MAMSFFTILRSKERSVVKRAKNVIIDKNGVNKLAEEVIDFMLCNQHSIVLGTTFIRQLPGLYPSFFDIRNADWLFVLHTLNFSLLIPNSIRQWTVNKYTGFWALCSAIKRAIDDGKSIWDPNYYMNIGSIEFEYIFRGDDEITLPYLKERYIILQNVGKTLKKTYNGSFINCVRASGYNANKLTKMLFKFDSYQDEVIFQQKRIRLYTKAKLLISDLRTYFPISPEEPVKTSTLLIDYSASQVLLQFKAIHYTDHLHALLKNGILIYGDIEELEIRCCLIYAVQMVYDEVRRIYEKCVKHTSILDTLVSRISTVVDNYIFHYQIMHNARLMYTIPLYHIRTTNY
ncbi:queuosine salvage protein [Monomorium pharaonis]|uniref:queuosine salvage protein n=1 Tax=Monomorium pharaonis TaxID=307658 RepID=UPI0017467530|nr:queuosine salvage protein [Monomorium pharaonis]